MIDFEEELKKFHPSLELSEVEDAVNSHDMSDMMDLLISIVNMKSKDSAQDGYMKGY